MYKLYEYMFTIGWIMIFIVACLSVAFMGFATLMYLVEQLLAWLKLYMTSGYATLTALFLVLVGLPALSAIIGRIGMWWYERGSSSGR